MKVPRKQRQDVDSTLHRWFRHTLTAGFVVAAMCAGPLAVYAQEQPSLADLARQEAARRKALKTPSKVITDKDLKPARPVSPQAVPGTAPAVPTAQEVPAAEEPAGETHDEAWWKGRMEQLREELRRSEIFAETLQTKINALTTDFVNRDDPYQRAKVGEERQKMLAEQDRVKSDTDRIKKAITDLEEEARRAGVPPGWIR